MKTRIFLFVALISLFYGTVRSQPRTESPVKIKSSGKISNLQVKSLCQDSLGYIWIATAGGLDRYDGSRYVRMLRDDPRFSDIPNSSINQLLQDSKQRLWIATSGGLCRYDFLTEKIHTYYYTEEEDTHYCVLCMTEDSDGNLWLGSSERGLLQWNGQTEKVVQPQNALKEQSSSSANCISADENHNLWVGFASSFVLGKYNTRTEQNALYNLPNSVYINTITPISDSLLWLGTDQGFLTFNTVSEVFSEGPQIVRETPGLNYAQIHEVKRLSKDIYVISSSAGAYKYNARTEQIRRVRIENVPSVGKNDDITCALEDDQGNLWLGTFNRGLSVKKNSIKAFNRDSVLSRALENRFVTSCTEDTLHGNLWFGTRYDGLYCYNAKNKRIRRFNSGNTPALSALKTDFIQSLFCDSHGQLWIGIGSGLLVGKLTADGIGSFRNVPVTGSIVSITEDYSGNVWLGSSLSGLYLCKGGRGPLRLIPGQRNMNITKIIPYTPELMIFSNYGMNVYTINTETFKIQPLISNTEKHAQMKFCVSIYQDSEGMLWFGSYAHGLLRYDPSNERTAAFTERNGLPGNDIVGITEDKEGKLWITTSQGLSRMNPQTSRFYDFNLSDGLHNTQFHEKAILRASDGQIYMGGNFGLDFFDSDDLRTNYIRPKAVLEELWVQNERISPAPERSPLKESLSFTKKIRLNHKQNSFAIEYTGLDFLAPEKISYSYRLEGYDTTWIEAGNLRRAAYSNLPPGRYTFSLRARNNDGLRSRISSVEIRIRPAPWFTVWAFLLYIAAGVFLARYFVRLYTRAKYSEKSLALTERQLALEHGIIQQKTTFYNNISHELRTPLTLINGNLDLFTRNRHFSQEERKYLSLTIFNVNRLLKLINQLLDFNRIEYDSTALKVVRMDAAPLIRNISNTFRFNAQSKNISYTLHLEEEHIFAYIDDDKLEKILTNLLSNAVKYTYQGGSISIHVGRTNGTLIAKNYDQVRVPQLNYMECVIHNTADEIPPDKLEQIFDRYTRLEAPGLPNGQTGSGIGLHYTKELTTIHKGFIKAESDSSGVTFSFALPIEKDAYDQSEIADTATVQNPQAHLLEQFNVTDLSPAPAAENSPHKTYSVLIVEDDPQVHNLLQDILCRSYNILHAYNGAEALDTVRKKMPDMVISDVRMPEMDGFELCRAIKNDPRLNHIITILLTARTKVEEYVEGYARGADAYLTKPFNIDHLTSVIDSLIRNRARLKARLGLPSEAHVPDGKAKDNAFENKHAGKPKTVLSETDRRFLDKLHAFIDDNIENPDININAIAVELGFSRTSFYRKIKTLTGMAPNDYVRNFKMKKAAQLIVEGNLSIAEISDQTGFGTQSHFSTAFKKFYGVSPKDYKESQSA